MNQHLYVFELKNFYRGVSDFGFHLSLREILFYWFIPEVFTLSLTSYDGNVDKM